MYVIPSIHPAALLRDQSMAAAVVCDLQKAVRIHAEGPTLLPACYRRGESMPAWALYPTLTNVQEWLHLWQHELLACDFESTYHGDVVCFGMWPVDRALSAQGLCIPFLNKGGAPYWHGTQAAEIRGLVSSYLADPRCPKVGQNWVGFDELLARDAFGVTVRGTVGDTMVAHHCVMPEMRHGLAFLSSMFTDLGPYKIEVHEDDAKDDVQKATFSEILMYDEAKLREYNLLDCFATALTWTALVEMMEAA